MPSVPISLSSCPFSITAKYNLQSGRGFQFSVNNLIRLSEQEDTFTYIYD